MKYHGIELKEVTTPQMFDPPKPMLVWDNDCGCPAKLNVCAIVNREGFRVITENAAWRHCAEIPEPKFATCRELAKWLAEGKGQVQIYDNIYTILPYKASQENSPAEFKVREWSETEWHSPTREYLGLEDK